MIALAPGNVTAQDDRLFSLHYYSEFDALAIFKAAKQWNDQIARPLAGEIRAHDNDRSPQRRLRIGYISPDFRRHCLSLFSLPLLTHHDRSQVEIYVYSCVAVADRVTARFQRQANVWRDISRRDDQAAAELIRQDKIDILVEITMHMAGNRLLMLARKPAPIQVTWLGYPGTTGLETMDYRLTDPRLDPAGSGEPENRTNDQKPNDPISKGVQAHRKPLSHLHIGALGVDSDFGLRASDFSTQEPYYSERSVRLPDTFWCYDPRAIEETEAAEMPEPGPLPALTSGRLTFGCLNNFCKVTDATLALWAKVMAALSDSRLKLLLAPGGPPLERVLQVGSPLGARAGPYVSATPAVFGQLSGDRPVPGYHSLQRPHHEPGCAVDGRAGGDARGAKASWSGPQVGLSQLHNLDLLELVAWSDEQFVKIAVELAGDLDRLSGLRATLRQRMERSPLMDGPRFASNMEAAYRQMWRVWCGLPGTIQTAG